MESSHSTFDLHLHTAVSDGTDTPAELLSAVRATGLDCFSVTDHDAILGCEAIRALLRPGDPRFLFGVEFSCKDEEGKYHILGYGYDPSAPAIRSVTEEGHARRIRKLAKRLELLRSLHGFIFTEEDERSLYALNNPGKPHIANLMLRYGYAETKKQAFYEYLNKLPVQDDYIRPEEAIRGVLGAGGIPVLAHPCYGDGDQLILGDELENRIRRLIGFGLAGLEGYYSGFSVKLREQMLALARQFGLYVTAGSDYHGKNKMISLGDTGLVRGDTVPDGLERFLKDVRQALP